MVQARSAALRLRIARGEMIPRLATERRVIEMAMQVRDRVMSAPARCAAIIAAAEGLPPAVVNAALESAARRMLNREADAGDALRATRSVRERTPA